VVVDWGAGGAGVDSGVLGLGFACDCVLQHVV